MVNYNRNYNKHSMIMINYNKPFKLKIIKSKNWITNIKDKNKNIKKNYKNIISYQDRKSIKLIRKSIY